MKLIIIHKDNNSTTSRFDNLLRFAISSEPIAGVILDGLSASLCRPPAFRRKQEEGWGHNAVCAIPKEWSVEPTTQTAGKPVYTEPACPESCTAGRARPSGRPWLTARKIIPHKTQDPRHKTQDPRHKTQDPRHKTQDARIKIIPYMENVPISPELMQKIRRDRWFVVSNGRFATQINSELLEKVLAGVQADVIAVNVEPEVLGKREKMRLTVESKVAGFRRFYFDSAEPTPVPDDWPTHIFIKTNVLDQVLADPVRSKSQGVTDASSVRTSNGADGSLPQSFTALLERCRSNALTVRAVNVGGTILDLGTESGLLNFCRARLLENQKSKIKNQRLKMLYEHSRLVGEVLLGKNVQMGAKVIIVGPSIIGDNVTIEQGAVINSSIIGPEVCVPQNQLVRNCILTAENAELAMRGTKDERRWTMDEGRWTRDDGRWTMDEGHDVFVSWQRFSYAGSIKRIVDCIAAIIMLILFAPILPFIALAIKLTSPGPVFFKDKRQGLRGKEFYCLKFRTMTVGAEKIQDKLRNVSLVDGPQFKMADDPRVSAVGKFLRDTYIDEIPQFLNVLLGQMSVVGPRPSPESENTLCPTWRDARLSVRPGITGLWQVCRTRQPMKDFQEWIYYDTKYIRNLSLKTDLWICWQTVKKLCNNFISQF